MSSNLCKPSPSKSFQLTPLINDDYFMASAWLSSQRSKDPVAQAGAVIVNEDNLIVSSGYNALPSRCEDNEHLLAEKRCYIKRMFMVHAETNAILNNNCTNLKNTRLYTTLCPCNECAKLIVQSGISKVLYISDKYPQDASRLMFDRAGIVCERYIPQQKSIVIDFESIL